MEFSSERSLDPLHHHLAHVMKFLTFYQILNVGYSNLNAICRVLLSVLMKLMLPKEESPLLLFWFI